MSHKVVSSFHSEFLEIKFSGKSKAGMLLQEGFNTASMIESLIKEHHYNRLLLKWDIEGDLVKSQTMTFIANLDLISWKEEARFAFLISSKEHKNGRLQFLKKVFEQTHLNLKLFKSEQAAIQWLSLEEQKEAEL